jgi:hypothetical protein
MTEFLKFLNTADVNTMTKIPGITAAIAANIIAARPFEEVNDCLKVRGMGKNLLARMQSAFEAGQPLPENNAMLTVAEEAMPALNEKSQSASESGEERSSFFSRLGQAFIIFLRALLRLFMLILVIGGFGAGLYYGLPYVNKAFIAPVEQNTARVTQLEAKVSNLQTQLDEMNGRVGLIETSVETHTASLEKLKEMQTTLEGELAQNNDKVLLELNHEVMMARALDMLGRARLYLAQSNFGLAREDVKSAHDLLAALQTEINEKLLGQVIDRLDLALGNLPAFPVVASGDLEIAWQLLMSGMPANTGTATPSPAAFPTFTLTAQILVTSSSTPEPYSTMIATATP